MKVENQFCKVIEDGGDVTLNRGDYIGGSDAGAIVGSNKYRSPLDVCLEKRGEGAKFEGNSFTIIGDEKESFIRETMIPNWFKREGIKAEVFESAYTYVSKAYPYMNAHVDGIVKHADYGTGILEIKTISPNAHRGWKDGGAPQSYIDQILHYMIVLGLDYGLLFGECGSIVETRWIFREDYQERIHEITTKEKEFFNRYMEGVEYPEPTTASDGDRLLEMYPEASDEVIQIPEEYIEWIERYTTLNAVEKNAKEEKSMIQAKLKSFLGQFKSATNGDHKITWTRSKKDKFDQKVFAEENPDLVKKYTVETTFSRMTIK